MTRGPWLLAALLCALPAHGANQVLSEAVVSVLTPIDSVPTSDALDRAFAPDAAIGRLREIALDGTRDLGIQLRAIRALPAYCPPATAGCGPGTTVHDTLVALVASYSAAATPQEALRLQAAAEALGATRSGLPGDAQKLLPLLASRSSDPRICGPGRDVRATAARALGLLCDPTAIDALRPYQSDACAQVAVQVRNAMQVLELCPR